MPRVALLAMLLLGACPRSLDVTVDGGPALDLAAVDSTSSCPTVAPTGADVGDAMACPQDGLSCAYPDRTCDCRGGDDLHWYCRSTSCPDRAAVTTGGACGTVQAQLLCVYGFEDSCTCVTPDDRWLCCGGTTLATCPSAPQLPKTGDLCCGFGPSCASECDAGALTKTLCDCNANHLECTVVSCATDGGV